ncbi:MAG: carboxylating nicotinate-nucleotide diphosphorylase [Phycisphaerales bacterium]
MEPPPAPHAARTPTIDLNALSLGGFAEHLRGTGAPRRLLELAHDEDLGDPPCDATGELMLGETDTRRVQVRSRSAGIVSGLAFLPDLIEVFADKGQITCWPHLEDGQAIEPGSVLAELSGDARAIVRIERTLLNLIARMSGIATRTAEFVGLVDGTTARICDTRKTTPGLRAFEKYAVRCGGGTTHRMGLYDAVLIKDNHLAGMAESDYAAALTRVAAAARGRERPVWFVQVEVDTLDQLARVLSAPQGTVDMVLLDNMGTDQLRRAVEMRDAAGSGPLLEASGGVSRESVREIAQTGVDRISIGGLTHQAQSLDLGLDAV